MYVRPARLEPHSYLWEHRDYTELRDTGRHRLHIPLVTNPSAVLVTAGARVHLAAGALWRLTPSRAHGVCNTTGPDRLHLIADVYADNAYQALAARPHLHDGDAADLPQMTAADRAGLLARAGQLADLGFTDAAEQTLLRAFYTYALPEGGAYDLIAELHAGRRADADGSRWRAAKAHRSPAPDPAPISSPERTPYAHPCTSAHRADSAGRAGARPPAGTARRPGRPGPRPCRPPPP
ncbi:aspartyl/asparaginyl beta-hydroxylase domain-containing protein [Streptomyces sp. NPDC051658]|uniref:aspartyl/asparaginyl beta-hydroxylase domain-containing protein n=1 Tax=Streptomyces sp. NPDC051658 TaxID=3365667 RepID=UPI0037BA958A